MSKIKIIEPGFFSTIQDGGRIGHRHKGVPLSGPMDKKAFEFAHKLVGNDYQKCLIEKLYNLPDKIMKNDELSNYLRSLTYKLNPVYKEDTIPFGKDFAEF